MANLIKLLGKMDEQDRELDLKNTFDEQLRIWLKSLSSISYEFVMNLRTTRLRGIDTLEKEDSQKAWEALSENLNNDTAIKPPTFLDLGATWNSKLTYIVFKNVARILNWNTYLNAK